jgi:YwiC-like protein
MTGFILSHLVVDGSFSRQKVASDQELSSRKVSMNPQAKLTPPKPKEHGTWGMLYVPLIIAIGVAGTLSAQVLILTLAVTLVFLSQRPYAQLLSNAVTRQDFRLLCRNRTWLGIYWFLSAALFGFLYLHYQLVALPRFALVGIPIAVAFTVFLKRNRVRSAAGELVGISGLTLTAPLAHYTAVGQVQTIGFWLWGLCVLYFASSVFYVKAVVASSISSRLQGTRHKPIQEWSCLSYHAALLIVIVGLGALNKVPAISLVAFMPVIIRGLLDIWRPKAKLDFARIGWTEVTYSIFFALITIFALRSETLPQ